MNRNEKIKKLANAVREFRGSYVPSTGQWIRTPKPDKKERVIFWLQQLHREDVPKDFALICNFRSYDDFNAWIGALDKKPENIY